MCTNINTDRNTAKSLAASDVFIHTYTHTHPRNTSLTRAADVFSIPKTNSFSFGTALKTERFFAGQYSLKNTHAWKKISLRLEILFFALRNIFLCASPKISLRLEILFFALRNFIVSVCILTPTGKVIHRTNNYLIFNILK
jgi:hypothetical protein